MEGWVEWEAGQKSEGGQQTGVRAIGEGEAEFWEGGERGVRERIQREEGGGGEVSEREA